MAQSTAPREGGRQRGDAWLSALPPQGTPQPLRITGHTKAASRARLPGTKPTCLCISMFRP